ncbi:MAG TPA: hypothetical protein V6C52_11460 [Coleofasciculaceae cyanobacterium]|jgi:hypothetical protein
MVERLNTANYTASPTFGAREPKTASPLHAFSLLTQGNTQTECGQSDIFSRRDGENRPINAACDGKFSFRQAGRNFFRGLVAPVVGLFRSPKDFLFSLGVGTLILGAIASLGVSVAPLLFSVALGFAGVQAGMSLYKMMTAQNGDERERAFYGLGSASGSVMFCALASKYTLDRFHGLRTEEAGFLQNLLSSCKQAPESFKDLAQHFRLVPESIRRSYAMIRSGQAVNNLRTMMKLQEKPLNPAWKVPDRPQSTSRLQRLANASLDGPPFPMPDFRAQ